MKWLLAKYMITAFMVIVVSEFAKRSDRLGGFVGALPLITLLTLLWLYVEHQPEQKIANHAWYTFWYVLPTLPMFILFPTLLFKIGFWYSMGASIIITVLCFGALIYLLKPFGIELL